MNAMIVLRLEGQAGFLLVDPASGTVRPMDAEDAPSSHDEGTAPRYTGVAEAYALPPLPSIPSRKFYRS